MHWILQENLFKESEWDNLVGTLERFNLPYSVHKVVPFVGELIPEPEPRAEKVICFGSYSMRHAAKHFGWSPGVYDLEPVTFEVQREHWGGLMLNHDSQVMAFKDVTWDEQHGDLRFIRPIKDSKVFAGKVYDWEEFRQWQRNVCVLEHDYGDSLTKDTIVQVSTPKKIFAEYRFWVVDAQAVTCSLYKRGDQVIYSSEVDNRVKKFVGYLLRHGDVSLSMRNNGWQPHRAYVLDVADTPDGFKIVEINTINAAGFYAADVQKLVMALENLERFTR